MKGRAKGRKDKGRRCWREKKTREDKEDRRQRVNEGREWRKRINREDLGKMTSGIKRKQIENHERRGRRRNE